MFPKWHVLFGAIFSISFLLLPQVGIFEALLIFLSSFLIDVDHYLHYVFRKKDFNLKKSYVWFKKNVEKYDNFPEHKRKKVYKPICWLHGFEFFLILSIFAIFFSQFLFLILGLSFHYLIDAIWGLVRRTTGHHLSSTYRFLKAKNLKHIEEVR